MFTVCLEILEIVNCPSASSLCPLPSALYIKRLNNGKASMGTAHLRLQSAPRGALGDGWEGFDFTGPWQCPFGLSGLTTPSTCYPLHSLLISLTPRLHLPLELCIPGTPWLTEYEQLCRTSSYEVASTLSCDQASHIYQRELSKQDARLPSVPPLPPLGVPRPHSDHCGH